MKLKLTLVTLLFPFLAAAGFESGNGGDVIICNGVPKFLDYYFSAFGWIELGPDDLDPYAKVEIALKRIEKYDVNRAKLYRKWAKQFESEALRARVRLSDVDDSVFAPEKNCHLEQLVLQFQPESGRPYRYYIDQDLYERLSPTNQAGMILHELIYREAIGLGQQKSTGPRLYNTMIASDWVSKLTQYEYESILRTIDFPILQPPAYPHK